MDLDSDRYAKTFSEALFTYLWYTENFISGKSATETITAIVETVDHMFEFVSEAAKAVVVLSVFTGSSFNDDMEDYFKKHAFTRRSVFTFLTRRCFDDHEEKDDIFKVVINSCTFVYRLFIYCERQGYAEFVQFASMCWTEIFNMFLKEEFCGRGGWDEFRTYVGEHLYLSNVEEADQKALEAFLSDINYLFPKLNKDPDPNINCNMPTETTANLESSCVEGLTDPQTNGGADGFSFGTIDDILSEVPDFNEKGKAVVFQFDNSNAKIVKLPGRPLPKRKSFGKSSLPAKNLVIDTSVIEKESAAFSSIEHYSTEHNSKNGDVVHETSTAIASTVVHEDAEEETIQANTYKELLGSEKDNAPEDFYNIVKSFFSGISGGSPQEGNRIKDDQVVSKDLLNSQDADSPNADNLKLHSNNLVVNGKCFDKFSNLTKDTETDTEDETETEDELDTEELDTESAEESLV